MEKKQQQKDKTSFWYFGVGGLLALSKSRGHNVKIDKAAIKDLKPPFVVLCNHQGYYDWVYAAKALMPNKVRFVVSRYQFLNPKTGPILQKMGAIPKSQFTSDASAVKEIIRTVKRGGIVGIYPSGKLSLFGEDEKPLEGTYELIKKLNVPVVFIQVDGSYRTAPRYNIETKKGRVDVKLSILFTPGELASLPAQEGKAKLNAAFCHDDFASSTNNVEFKSKNIIAGLDDMAYICPSCKTDYTMKTDGPNRILCTKCGFSATMDNRFRLTGENGFTAPKTISEWGRFIKAEERERVLRAPEAKLTTTMKLMEHVNDEAQLSQTGTVTAELNSEGISLRGKRGGEPFERFFTYAQYPAMHIFDKIYLLVPDNEEVLCVSPATAAETTKWGIASEVYACLSAEGLLKATVGS
ncbi:MAG: 1-acyl-sn-glycerol-3-phosphate acyltransferase [Oscillospiraceae bacterium]|jgi:DNA-directed RNA polymerase subunit RPC12/RpoP|nr:1-acyl-sn-glycerol-3-phosphate acyltransferase [Oscillospiraceae bacterium]